MQTIVRSFLATHTKRLDKATRVITFVGTKESPDRTGDIIRVDGWEFENFQKNPVFLWNHNPSLPPIGKVIKIQTIGKEVHFDVQFATESINPFAETVFKLFAEGFLSAVSVGFIPKDIEPIFMDGDLIGLDIMRQELLELSAVAIPAHQDALAASVFGDSYKGYCEEYEQESKSEAALSLEDFRKTYPTKEEDEIMKEELAALTAKVTELEDTLKSILTLRESVDLSVKTMETLNKAIVVKLSEEVPSGPSGTPVAPVGSTPIPTLNLEKLMGSLGSVLQKIEQTHTKPGQFKVEGEQ